MPGPKLFNDTVFAFQRVMDFRSQRHNLVSSNLSNAETPGYKAKDVQFEGILREAISTEKGLPLVKTNDKHIDAGGEIEILRTEPEVVKVKTPVVSFDGNTVSVEKEMARLNENSLLYQTETEVLARLFSGLKFAVNDGGR
ncbi:flagellar basal body rod protein FlgB [Nitrospinota bacterium]